MKILKVCNPIIYFINLLMYLNHLDIYRFCGENYSKYDLSKDLKYF